MKKFSFDDLTPTEFENFSFELLQQMNFEVNWRKGTGKESSPSDNGRDIEGTIYKSEIDGTNYNEKWFIEVKQSLTGVGAEKLNNAITWANAERPDVLLFIVSNFLSNQAKNFLKNYVKNNNPPFKIKYWEITNLEKLTKNRHGLLKKFDILNVDFEFINALHPVHLEYMRKPSLNSLDYFFSLLEGINVKKRDKIFSFIYASLSLDNFDYENFKKRIYYLSKIVDDQFLIESIINFTLSHMFQLGDKTSVPEFIKSQENMIEFSKLTKSGNINPNDYYPVTPDQKKLKSVATQTIAVSEKNIRNAEKIFDDNYLEYIYLCENIVGPLFDQEPLDVFK